MGDYGVQVVKFFAIVNDQGVIRRQTNSLPPFMPEGWAAIPISSVGIVDPLSDKWDFTAEEWIDYVPPDPLDTSIAGNDYAEILDNMRDAIADMPVAEVKTYIQNADNTQLKKAMLYLVLEVRRLGSL